MASLTTDGDSLVVRLVYDGPPRSGKTTSLRALAEGMAGTVVSPGEVAGRTQYFDWLEYVGGNFDGLPIRCQILTVPGQEELSSRRLALLAEADAVVFVANGSPEHLPAAAAHLRGLRELLSSRPVPQPGVVVQANHRDRPDALSLGELQGELGLDNLALVESVATESQGIREAFVLAVRLALDRARELMALGELPSGPGETDDPASLLAWLKSAEGEPPGEPVTPPPDGSPRLPHSSVPSGWIWPPVDGRVLLHAASPSGATPQQGPDGAWRLTLRRDLGIWHFHSAPRHEFESPAGAQEELLRWAQRHAPRFSRLSPNRCIALAETGAGTWRLWQVVRAEETWRQRLEVALREAPSPGQTEFLHVCEDQLLAARSSFREEPPLPCRLGVIAGPPGQPLYAGLLPPVDWSPPEYELALTDAELVKRELGEAAAPTGS